MSQGNTGCHRGKQGVLGVNRVSQGKQAVTGDYRVSQGCTWCHRGKQGVPEEYSFRRILYVIGKYRVFRKNIGCFREIQGV